MSKEETKLNFYIDGNFIGSGTSVSLDVPQTEYYTLKLYKNGDMIYQAEMEAITVKAKWYEFWKWFN